MERPERPTRHKSNPVLKPKYSLRASFSSDSDSDQNESEIPVQITYYRHQSETDSIEGPSTSSVIAPSQNNTESTSGVSKMSGSSSVPQGLQPQNPAPFVKTTCVPRPLRVTLSPVPCPEDEVRSSPPLDPIVNNLGRRKRPAASFETIDTLIASTPSERAMVSPEGPSDSFSQSDYSGSIRPRSFCNIDLWASRVSKLKRLGNGPIDLTSTHPSSSTATRNDEAQLNVYPLPENTESNAYYSSNHRLNQGCPSHIEKVNPVNPYVRAQPQETQASNSSILRQFDELCSSRPRRRPRPPSYSVSRFLHEGDHRLTESSTTTECEHPLITRDSGRPRNSAQDDYSDLIGNFFYNFPTPSINSDNQRSPPLPPERVTSGEQPSTSTADVISRRINTPEIVSNYIYHPRSSQVHAVAPCAVGGGTPLELEPSNDDVIILETPERQYPLPVSSLSDVIPSSRSPTPTPTQHRPPLIPLSDFPVIGTPTPTPTTAKHNKTSGGSSSSSARGNGSGGDVPMTLSELNQTLVSLLECPVCLDHATPPIYQCVKGHILCQSCHPRLSTCPICRARLPGDRNSTMEKVAEKLMYPCKNTVTGCTMMLKLDDKQMHEEGCGFRHYACIITSCTWKGYKPELVVHLQSNHPDKLIIGDTKEVQVPLSLNVHSQINVGTMLLAHHWIQSAHNEVFNVIFHVDLYKRIMKGCVVYIGSPEKAGKFTYEFQLKQHDEPFRKLTYSRSTHADTFKQGQPLTLSHDFSINIDMARLYRPDDWAASTIPVTVSILPTPDNA